MRIERFDDHPCQLGEGPVWDATTGTVRWLDIVRSQVHHRALDGGERRTETVEHAIGSFAPTADGRWVVADASGLAVRRADGVHETLVDHTTLDPAARPGSLRCNDGGVDPAGGFWFGTMAWDMAPGQGALYRVDPDTARPVRILEQVSISNGLGWSPDGTVQYHIDSATGRIDRFEHDPATGAVADRRPFVTIAPELGVPDGCCVDAEGGVWVALWGGGAVHRYDREGRFDRAVELPTPQVTSCAFVGRDLDRLVITTAAVELADPTPDAGATFLLDPGVTGVAVPPARLPADVGHAPAG
ncbi:MAG: SMP-30/gluconolactonase/LRE family protein [Nitriliruptoraceae bacterium]|nr:SMP-30/gluconolactonase/LRE family protein [Nitriliruptoraceae bacterium]